MSFDEIYRSIGFKPVNNNLKQLRKLSPKELADFKSKKHYQIVNSEILEMPQPEKYEAVAACPRCPRTDIYVTKRVVNDHFRYVKK